MGGPDTGLTEEESKEMESRLKDGKMTFNDFLKQVQVMNKAADLQNMLKQGPFGGNVSDDQVMEGQRKLKSYSKFVEFMAAEERDDPELLISEAQALRAGNSLSTAPRMQKLAEASGSKIEDV